MHRNGIARALLTIFFLNEYCSCFYQELIKDTIMKGNGEANRDKYFPFIFDTMSNKSFDINQHNEEINSSTLFYLLLVIFYTQ